MKITTLGYIEFNNSYLMLYRDKNKGDGSQGKWLGVGGKCEPGETPDACFLREALEETGILLTDITRRGIVDYTNDSYENERMFLYTARVSDSFFSSCDEGILKWVPKDEVLSLPMWEGDHFFLEKFMTGEGEIIMTLKYSGDELIKMIPDKLELGEVTI